MMRHTGGCHCGRVRFEVFAPPELEVSECNCSICARAGFLHLLVPGERFRLLSGTEHLSSYQFGTGTARHLFCSVCGIKSFYVPRTNPNGFSVNARCLDAGTFTSMRVQPFDGLHWEFEVAAGKLPAAERGVQLAAQAAVGRAKS